MKEMRDIIQNLHKKRLISLLKKELFKLNLSISMFNKCKLYFRFIHTLLDKTNQELTTLCIPGNLLSKSCNDCTKQRIKASPLGQTGIYTF